ncbi:uncharacterized protein LOC129598931 [Paramacrobiotus metropolitanus]|uniref:uncharacterized protein LOC129598931 n=1 Tax=Paramacrobiotus metropolitanus TaxID=2943436 RepID=UPI002446444C|nr:uncharacterized protein LOC129598931 [Paramacrobiotus metropolitanus]
MFDRIMLQAATMMAFYGFMRVSEYYGKYLTRQRVSILLQSCFGHTVSTHSFRIGAASTAANAGITLTDVQKMGRWTSDVVNRYIQQSSVSNSHLYNLIFYLSVDHGLV